MLNQSETVATAEAALPLLDVIRRDRHLTGCKEGCREGDCGACLVLIGGIEQSALTYRPATACLVPLAAVAGQHIVTIEGLNGDELNPIQRALVEQGGIQCGFCTPGIVVALTAFFLNSPASDAEAAIDAVAGNLCRCTGYGGIKRAIRQLCGRFDLAQSPAETRLNDCMRWQLLPAYFAGIAERLSAIPSAEADGDNQGALLVAGGSDLMVHRRDSAIKQTLRLLKAPDDQERIGLESGRCRIAAATTIEQLRTSPLLEEFLPMLGDDLQLLGSAPIRQRATVGGNLANASPIADLAVLFLALNTSLTLVKDGHSRSVALRHFFLDYKQTACQAGELIQDIHFDCAPPVAGFSFEKVCKRTHLDIASVNSALSIRLTNDVIDSVHLSAGGVAPIPLYLAATCDYLRGKAVRSETVLAAAAIAQTEIAPVADFRGSVEYKRLLFRQLLFAHFLKLFPDRIRWEAMHANG